MGCTWPYWAVLGLDGLYLVVWAKQVVQVVQVITQWVIRMISLDDMQLENIWVLKLRCLRL